MRYKAELSRAAKKDMQKAPRHIVLKLWDWIQDLEDRGLPEVRKIPSYHDEPLFGDRWGQRSIRLSKSYRAFYVEKKTEIVIVKILEVNKHEY